MHRVRTASALLAAVAVAPALLAVLDGVLPTAPTAPRAPPAPRPTAHSAPPPPQRQATAEQGQGGWGGMQQVGQRLPAERVRALRRTQQRVGERQVHESRDVKRVPGTDKASVRAAMEAAGVLSPRRDGEPSWLRFQRGRSGGGEDQEGFVSSLSNVCVINGSLHLYGTVLEKERFLCL
eukprot:gene30650-17852_t